MTPLLNEGLAGTLQYITFPLEVIGLALALIEVRYPQTAQAIAMWLAKLAEPLTSLRDSGGDTAAMGQSLGSVLSLVFRVVLPVLFVILVTRFLISLGYSLLTEQASGTEIMSSAIAAVVTLVVLTVIFSVLISVTVVAVFFLIAGTSDFSQRFVQGRAVGTLGILIAGLGVLGEGYQVVVQLFV